MSDHFHVNFNIFLEQSSCAFSWLNIRCDNIKMHGGSAGGGELFISVIKTNQFML